MKYLYSVIIPYRDTIDLLSIAVDSIPDRNDIQIIIVDNSVTPLIEGKVPVKHNANVLYLLSEPSKGAGRARNVGLEHAKGQWLLFLDADDYFTKDAFNHFDKYIHSNFDIIFFDADSINLKDRSKSTRHLMIHQYITSYLEHGEEDSLRYRFVNPIAKMMRASFVLDNNFRFEEVRASNDQMFSIWTGHAAKKITADGAIVYMITAGEKNSSLTKTRSAENQWARFQVAIRQYHFMESIGRKDLRFHLLSSVFHAFTEFGLSEGFRYLKYVWKERVNIFLF